MSSALSQCTFRLYDESVIENCAEFICGHADLDDFFKNDAVNYTLQLIGKTYCFTLDEHPEEIVCAFTLSNDSIKLKNIPNARKRKINANIPFAKHFNSYPAVLIGRLGVNANYAGKGIGRELMDFIKAWFIDENNKTGCRFIVVDAYNETDTLGFYERNGFQPLFSSDEQEKEYYGIEKTEHLKTKFLFFDLITLSNTKQ